MRSLGVRLALAFMAVIAVSVGGVAVLAGRETAQEFQSYVERGRVVYLERMASGLTNHYGTYGSWEGAGPLLQGWSRGPSERLAVADASGTVVADTGESGVGESADAAGLGPGTPLLVNGRRVGTLHVTVASPFGRRPPRAMALDEQGRLRTQTFEPDATGESTAGLPADVRRAAPGREGMAPGGAREPMGSRPPGSPGSPSSLESAFLDRVNRVLLVSALAAALLAGLLSLLFARHLAEPLRELAAGARRIAAGDLRYRVGVRERDEVGAVAVAFNDMAASLEQAEQARRNLVADVAHELRTPLTVIEGTVEAILDGVYPADQERLASIREEVELLNKLVADLRELSLAEAGGLWLEVEPVQPAALVRRAVGAAGARAEARHVTLRAEVADGLPLVAADAPRIAQVLAILLDNALRYTPPDGTVVVGASPQDDAIGGDRERPESVWTRLRHAAGSAASATPGAGPGVRFWVADNGPGIAADDLPHIFERFYRADPSRTRRSGGSGLGLAIARRYVEAHGGRIWAESPSAVRPMATAAGAPEAGRGTTVLFWLPTASRPSRPDDAAPATQQHAQDAEPLEAQPVHALRARLADFRR